MTYSDDGTAQNAHPEGGDEPNGQQKPYFGRIVRETGLVEWVCEHGIGHPDVDSAADWWPGSATAPTPGWCTVGRAAL